MCSVDLTAAVFAKCRPVSVIVIYSEAVGVLSDSGGCVGFLIHETGHSGSLLYFSLNPL